MPPPAPPGITGPGPAAGDRVYFAKAVLVSSSILPILLQSLVLQLQLPLQAAVQVRQGWGGWGRGGMSGKEHVHLLLGCSCLLLKVLAVCQHLSPACLPQPCTTLADPLLSSSALGCGGGHCAARHA